MAYAAFFEGKAAVEHVEALKTVFSLLAQESRNQPGTIRYEFYQQQADPTVILLFAIWEGESDWRAHVSSDVHKKYVASLPSGAWRIPPAMTPLQPFEHATDR